MKPNFVLDFSHDGIRLLHRTTGGWTLVGEVSLDDGDPGTSIGFLRQTALAMEPHGLATKLVVPNSQILFRTIDAPGPTDADRAAQIAAALDGLTPYDVDDLVFDWRASGDRVQVAAVAKETLAEAEAFAAQHKMNPVSFIAIPDAGAFDGEPFFGVTKAHLDKAGADPVAQDSSTVIVLGSAKDEPSGIAPADTTPLPDGRPASDTALPVMAGTPDKGGAGTHATTDPSRLPAATIAPLPDVTLPNVARTASAPAPSAPAAKETPRVTGIAEGVLASTAAASLTPGAVSKDVKAVTHKPAKPAKTGLLSRTSSAKAAPKHTVTAPTDTKEAMTVFGARKSAGRKGSPRFLALILTVTLLIMLAIAVILSSFVVGNGLSSLIGTSDRETTATTENEAAEDETLMDEADAASLTMPDILPADSRAAEVELPEMDSEQLVPEPEFQEPEPAKDVARPAPVTLQEARAAYAATGIWQVAPDQGPVPPQTDIEALYVASIDPFIASHDAIALPAVSLTPDDLRPASQVTPPSVGTVFNLNDKGNVTPTAKGTLTPEGVMVFAGRPAKVPRPRVTPDAPLIAPQPLLAGLRPKARPAGLVEQNEMVQLGGRLRSELAGLKPRARPESAQQAAEQAAQQDLADAVAQDVASAVANNPPPIVAGTKLAIATSRVPSSRPSNIASLADRANRQADARTAALVPASVAPDQSPTDEETADEPELASIAPSIPSSASVTRQATVTKAIKLNKINLIGVFGTPSQRRALVRLPNGKFVKLKVGDSVDGGKVAAIGAAQLSYVKRGRSVVLNMPKG